MRRTLPPDAQLVSIKEASEMLHIHPNTLRRWDNLGLLKAVRMGSRKDRSYPMNEILKFTSPQTSYKKEDHNHSNGASQMAGKAIKRLDQIQLVSAALSKLFTTGEVVNFITGHVVNVVNAYRAVVWMIGENGENLELTGFHNLSDTLIKNNGTISLQEPLPSVEAIKYGQPIIVESKEEMKERFPAVFKKKNWLASISQAYVALPLETPTQKFGTVGICFETPQSFNKDDISFMLYLARTYALALERAVFYEKEEEEKDQLQRDKDLLEQINQASLEFLNPLNIREAYGAIIREAQKITGAEFGSIFILENNRLERRYSSDKILNKIITRKRGDTYKTMQRRKAKIYQVKPENDPHPMLNRIGVKSALRIPIFYKNKSFGVINMLFKKTINYSDQELEILQLFGSLAAMAILNAKLNHSAN